MRISMINIYDRPVRSMNFRGKEELKNVTVQDIAEYVTDNNLQDELAKQIEFNVRKRQTEESDCSFVKKALDDAENMRLQFAQVLENCHKHEKDISEMKAEYIGNNPEDKELFDPDNTLFSSEEKSRLKKDNVFAIISPDKDYRYCEGENEKILTYNDPEHECEIIKITRKDNSEIYDIRYQNPAPLSANGISVHCTPDGEIQEIDVTYLNHSYLNDKTATIKYKDSLPVNAEYKKFAEIFGKTEPVRTKSYEIKDFIPVLTNK